MTLSTEEQFRDLLAKVQKITPQEPQEAPVQYLERVLEKYKWCFTVNKFISATMRNVPVILASMNSKGQFLTVTDSVTAVLGYSPTELQGQHISLLLEGKERASIETVFSKRLLKPRSLLFRATVQKKDGQKLFTLWDLVWSEQESFFFCTAHDLNRRSKVPQLIG